MTPSTGLVDGQSVSVTGSGLDPDTSVVVVQCTTAAAPVSTCADRFPLATTDPAGELDVERVVHRLLYFGFTTVDCATPGTCEIRAVASGGVVAATAPIAFDASVPPPPQPAIAVDPAAGLVDGQVVTVHGSGLAPEDDSPDTPPGGLFLVECAAGAQSTDDCDLPGSFVPVRSNAAGTLTVPFTVHRSIATTQGDVDCTTAPGCVVLLGGDARDSVTTGSPRASIEFAPVAAGAVAVAPSFTG